MKKIIGRILYADDDLDNNDPYIEHLQLMGYSVDIARNADQFLEKLKIEKWDLLILDIMFPRGSIFSREETTDNRRTGVMLLKRILQENNNVDGIMIPIIIRTAVTKNKLLKEQCLSLGVEEENYFEKPGDLLKIAKAVQKAIENKTRVGDEK